MELNHEKAEACLSNIDREAHSIRTTVSDSHSQFMENLERILEDYENSKKIKATNKIYNDNGELNGD